MDTAGSRIKARRKVMRISQRDLAIKSGWGDNQTRISSYESNRTEPNYSDMSKIAKVLKVSAAWLAFGGENPPATASSNLVEVDRIDSDLDPLNSNTALEADEVALPLFVDSEFSADDHNIEYFSSHGSKVRFSKSTLSNAGVKPESAICMTLSGNSMSPALPDGSVAGLDINTTNVKDGDLYAIQQGDMLRVRVLYRLPTGYRLRCFNEKDWSDEHVEGDAAKALNVVGRVFWYSVLR